LKNFSNEKIYLKKNVALKIFSSKNDETKNEFNNTKQRGREFFNYNRLIEKSNK